MKTLDAVKQSPAPKRVEKGGASNRSAAQGTPNRFSPLGLAFSLLLLLASFLLLPRVYGNPRLAMSFVGAIWSLGIFLWLLRRQVVRTGRKLSYEVAPKKVHYVQLMMHSAVYTYWGWYWRDVYHFVPLIIAQIVFVYALDMLVCWTRRDKWILGFGPFPIILSTNLFLWFKDDWFFLQFLMVAVGVLGKEFVTWKREGRRVHIFNPSAFGLALFSLVLIATKSTDITWGVEIARSITRPPHIYFEIFVLGLIVQGLFQVTLVTLSAAASLLVLNLWYTAMTGTYFFIDSYIPVAVFLGLHLLVTDPATSPRRDVGKVIFGTLYGAAVFGLYALLGWMGAPDFYDKLLCVPFLNLSVRLLDRASEALASVGARFRSMGSVWKWSPRQSNFAYMGVWISLFVGMSLTGFMTKNDDHPGGNPAFWQQACTDGRAAACKTWVRILDIQCRENSSAACFTLGQVMNEGRIVARDPVLAGEDFGQACDLGVSEACGSLVDFVKADGGSAFSQSCDRGNGESCFILGSLYSAGDGVPQSPNIAFDLFRKSCETGWSRGCGRLGVSYLNGQGTAADRGKAAQNFEKGCQGHNAASCLEAAKLYHNQGQEELAQEHLKQACDLGLQSACRD